MNPAEKTRLLAELVMGWRVQFRNTALHVPMEQEYSAGALTVTARISDWAPLTNLAHAGEVIGAMAKKGWSARIATNALSSDQNGCEFFRAGLGLGRSLFIGGYAEYGPDRRVAAVAETIPTAICHAALMAEGVKEEEL